MDRRPEDPDPGDHLLQVPHPGDPGGVLEELLQKRGGAALRDDAETRKGKKWNAEKHHERQSVEMENNFFQFLKI